MAVRAFTLPSIFRRLAPLGVVAALFSAAPVAKAQTGWEITKIEGREYVSVDSIKKFYNFSKLIRAGNSITLVTENPDPRKVTRLQLTIGSQECLMNNVKFVFSNAVEGDGGKAMVSRLDLAKLIDPVLRPNFIKNAGDVRTVIIDPGHGGKDAGATNPFGTESAYNLSLAFRVKALLEENGAFKVILTRTSDRYLTLQERVAFANAIQDNAIFISLHFNSGGAAARGIETFTLSPPGIAHYGRDAISADAIVRAGNEHDSSNIALATAVHGWVLRGLTDKKTGKCATLDRGIKRARFSVLSGVRHPAILFEGGFMSHAYEARLIENAGYQKTLAAGIAHAVKVYKAAVNPNVAMR